MATKNKPGAKPAFYRRGVISVRGDTHGRGQPDPVHVYGGSKEMVAELKRHLSESIHDKHNPDENLLGNVVAKPEAGNVFKTYSRPGLGIEDVDTSGPSRQSRSQSVSRRVGPGGASQDSSDPYTNAFGTPWPKVIKTKGSKRA
jgi:hypothetical protein